jgi:hypothetical protein
MTQWKFDSNALFRSQESGKREKGKKMNVEEMKVGRK